MHRSLDQINIFSKHLLLRGNTADMSAMLVEKETGRDMYKALIPAGSQRNCWASVKMAALGKSWQVGRQPSPMGNGTFMCIYYLIFSVS